MANSMRWPAYNVQVPIVEVRTWSKENLVQGAREYKTLFSTTYMTVWDKEELHMYKSMRLVTKHLGNG